MESNKKQIRLELTEEEINVIIRHLAAGKWADVNGLMVKLGNQLKDLKDKK